MTNDRGERGKPAPDEIQAHMRQLIRVIGITKAAKAVGISKEALGSLAAGGSVFNGTIALAEKWVNARPKGGVKK